MAQSLVKPSSSWMVWWWWYLMCWVCLGFLGVEGKSATVGDFFKRSQDWTGLDDSCRKVWFGDVLGWKTPPIFDPHHLSPTSWSKILIDAKTPGVLLKLLVDPLPGDSVTIYVAAEIWNSVPIQRFYMILEDLIMSHIHCISISILFLDFLGSGTKPIRAAPALDRSSPKTLPRHPVMDPVTDHPVGDCWGNKRSIRLDVMLQVLLLKLRLYSHQDQWREKNLYFLWLFTLLDEIG